jgi:hypothetical protein
VRRRGDCLFFGLEIIANFHTHSVGSVPIIYGPPWDLERSVGYNKSPSDQTSDARRGERINTAEDEAAPSLAS